MSWVKVYDTRKQTKGVGSVFQTKHPLGKEQESGFLFFKFIDWLRERERVNHGQKSWTDYVKKDISMESKSCLSVYGFK